ncbi:hypothetical protein EV122DRAFT_252641 [Schizophyllum commune]
MSSTPEDVIMDDDQLAQSSSNADNAHGEPSNTPADSANDTTDVPMADDNDEDGMPGLEPVDDLPPNRRRGRVLEDGDQDRDRRHPATRAAERDSRAGTPPAEPSDAPANTSTTTPSTNAPPPPVAPHDHAHHQPPADDPILNNPLSALISRTMRDFLRQTQAADRAHAPHPPVPTLSDILRRDIAGVTGQGPPTVNHNFFAGLFGVDPIPPNAPPTTQAGNPSDQVPATQPPNPQNPTPPTNVDPHPPTDNQPPPATPQPPPTNPLAALFGAFTGNAPNLTFAPNFAANFAPGGAFDFAPGGTFDLASLYPPPERDDPAKAKQIIDALEEVPVGLVQRLERVSPEGNGCAICWEGLLEGGGGGWNTQGGDDKGGEGTSHTAANAGGGGGEADATSAGGEGGEGAVDSSATADSANATTSSTSPPTSPTIPTPTPPRIVALPCSHVFHADCLVPWFSRPRQTTCPTCRFDVDPNKRIWRGDGYGVGGGGVPFTLGGQGVPFTLGGQGGGGGVPFTLGGQGGVPFTLGGQGGGGGIPIGGFTIPIPGNANAAQGVGAGGGGQGGTANEPFNPAAGGAGVRGAMDATGGATAGHGATGAGPAGPTNPTFTTNPTTNPATNPTINPTTNPTTTARPPLARLMGELLHGSLGEALGQRGDALRAQGIDPASVLPGGPGGTTPAATPAAGAGAAAGVAGSQAPGVATQAAPGPAPDTRGRGRRPNPAAELFPGYTPAQQEQMNNWIEAMMRSIFGGPPSGGLEGKGDVVGNNAEGAEGGKQASATPTTANATSPTANAPPKIDAAPTTNDTPPTATSAPPPTLTLHTPAQISALALVPHNICADTLVAGSADGTLRVYDLTSGRVTGAVRGLGDEVASIAIAVPAKKAKSTDDASKEAPLRAWVACGRQVLHFSLSPTAPLLQTAKDALAAVDVCEEDEGDAVNGITLLPRGAHLAFCTDAGAVGVLEIDILLSSPKIRRLRGRHSNLASTLHPVPHRPRELMSGGYDCQVVLHDWESGSVLGRGEVGAPPPSDDPNASQGISLSPPFVLSSAMSPSGVLAAGLADGRVWVGMGGEKVEPTPTTKRPPTKDKKRTKKWEGLDTKGVRAAKVAEGPVVGVAWKDERTFLACSLLGQLIEVTLERALDGKSQPNLRPKVLTQVESVSRVDTLAVSRVNALAVSSGGALAVSSGGASTAGTQYVVVGGVGEDGRGVVEVMRAIA